MNGKGLIMKLNMLLNFKIGKKIFEIFKLDFYSNLKNKN